MIEGLLPFIAPVDQIKSAPLVFDMALLAFAVFGVAVKSPSVLAFLPDKRVADLTFIGSKLAIRAVTFGAVLHSFEELMRFMQIARG